ncbi:tRNA (adenosine(37)-N6)-dimethylallyltransferase MiaA [Beggiatoa leptomitoformis]|uniref:tRNA dimethylallyltransferase n=2 Tax=Beggiatoa leptomitoformis TaxID=288004 RepID=A0A2N9YHV5_9GAMM|nr:tRNA (adenosine(37)-N6)-dimethylallyltransferase MiaA [Beggiatoa leptomitoformis]AUI70064.1 tRNA (adenosine(37)-N6)-dimethylallyltransferase MiaA [Beggiatoa leptomitoformis]
MNEIPCIFLMGPTAAGKTDLAVAIIQQFPCEIISVDSALVYRGMDIGTAKPTADILSIAPHHLIDICDPLEAYSTARFCKEALAHIQHIQAKGKIPLLVGGTGLYFRSLQQGLSDLPPADACVRERLNQELETFGLAALHARLAQVDPVAAQRIHPNDPQRIQRALEVYEISGVSMTEWYANTEKAWSLPHVLKFVIAPAQREVLHAKIAKRFKLMLEQGLVNEVETLFKRGDLHLSLPAMRAVGYRQVWQYLAGELDYAGMVEQSITATRQLAKRQLTWLRAEADATWFDSQQTDMTEHVLKRLVKIPMLSQSTSIIK